MFAQRKSVLIVVLLALLVTPILAACQPAKPTAAPVAPATPATAPTKAPAAAATTAPAAEPVEIQVWHRWSGTNAQILAELEKAFQDEKPNVKIKDVPQVGEYMDLLQKMIADLAAGKEPPDVFIGGYNLLNYIAEELQPIPIDQLGGQEAQQVFSLFDPAVLKLANVNGKQVGLPFAISNIVMYYNPDIFKAAGLDPKSPPQTWEEVFTVGKVIKEKTGKYPVAIQKMDNWADQALIFSNGGKLLSSDGKCVAFNDEGAVGAYEMWAKLHAEGLAPKASDEDINSGFSAGNIAMYATTIMKLNSFRQNAKFEVGVAPFPAFAGKRKALPAGGAAIIVFSKDQKKQRAAWELAKFLVSEKGMRIWTKTGYLCIIKAQVPIMQGQEVAYAQVPYAVPWLSWPGGAKGLEIDRTFLDTRTKIIYGEAKAKDALDKAVADANRLLGCK